ncbi:hypothetical protein Psi02_00100 [Planotetraspora silvatica]|uniref:Uncharacterized protein n=1 Tax=Planotetraspora silvatica TaxID=234614 RepID=A0A8J3UFN3_9ACTN|nr:hypothetical protein Psi02_00100 [Planotetraspora silvatica]
MLRSVLAPRVIPVPPADYLREGIFPAPWMSPDDELLSLLLTMWALHTGRLPADTPDHLTPEQLIDFWADEQTATGNPLQLQERR